MPQNSNAIKYTTDVSYLKIKYFDIEEGTVHN